MKIFAPEDSFCGECDRPLAFRLIEKGAGKGKWCPCEPDGSDHWDICRETQVKMGRIPEKNYDFNPDLHTTYPTNNDPFYDGDVPPWI